MKRSTTKTADVITQAEFARRLKVDPQRITKLIEAGIVQRRPDGRLNYADSLARATAYLRSRRDAEAVHATKSGLQARKLELQCSRLEVALQREKGDLVPRVEVTQDAARCAITLSATLNAAASELAPLLAGAALQAWEIEKLLKEKLLAARKVLSQSEFATLVCPQCNTLFAQS